MEFKNATDVLTGRVSHEELAGELQSSVASVRQARLSPDAAAHRSPPAGWRRAVARLARERGGDLVELAEQLEKDADALGE